MAQDVRIDDGSVGFLNSNGAIKSKKENNEAEVKINAAQQGKSTASDSATVDTSPSTALGKVKEAFSQQTNQIISGINQDEEKLSQAKSAIKEQLSIAKDLKAAIKDGDSEKADKLRKKFDEASQKRDALADDIKVYNDDRLTNRTQKINIGNEQKGIVKTDPVKLDKTGDTDLSSAKGVTAFIAAAKRDLQDVKDQQSNLSSKKDEIKKIVSDGQNELNSVEQNSIKSIADAADTASKIASQIKNGGQQAFEQATLSKFNDDASSKILTQLLG